jgi:hypothetical protein
MRMKSQVGGVRLEFADSNSVPSERIRYRSGATGTFPCELNSTTDNKTYGALSKGESHGSRNIALAARCADPDHHPDPAVLALGDDKGSRADDDKGSRADVVAAGTCKSCETDHPGAAVAGVPSLPAALPPQPFRLPQADASCARHGRPGKSSVSEWSHLRDRALAHSSASALA